MAASTAPAPVGGLVSGSRVILVALALLFVAGAVAQVFLAGLAIFDTAGRWADHTNLGHMLGLLAHLMWIPALVGRVGLRLIIGAVLLAVLFGFQYMFMESGEPYMQALHPVNALALFALALWVGLGAIHLLRRPASLRVAPPQ